MSVEVRDKSLLPVTSHIHFFHVLHGPPLAARRLVLERITIFLPDAAKLA